MKYFNYKNVGKSKPNIAIVACTHGDEIIGKKVINHLQNIKIDRGNLHLILANPEAVRKHKRYIGKDLNRSFPGKKNGKLEEKIAYALYPLLEKMDYVIDIHATNSNFKKLIIIVNHTKKIKKILKVLPTDKVAYMQSKNLGKKSLISSNPNSLCLEYGPNKSGKNFKDALKDIKIILKELDILKNKRPNKKYTQKQLYIVNGSYSVAQNFKQNNKLKDFTLIKKNELIGTIKDKKIYSTKKFYPIFLGKGRYNKTLALTSNKKMMRL